jgi:hypothetical protein
LLEHAPASRMDASARPVPASRDLITILPGPVGAENPTGDFAAE